MASVSIDGVDHRVWNLDDAAKDVAAARRVGKELADKPVRAFNFGSQVLGAASNLRSLAQSPGPDLSRGLGR